MHLRCWPHVVWSWPPLTSPSSFHRGFTSSRSITFNQPGWCNHKSAALARGGWHFKYVNAKAIMSLASLSLRLLTTLVTLRYCSALIGVCVSLLTWFCWVLIRGKGKSGTSKMHISVVCQRRERREGGRQRQVKRSGAMETDEKGSPGSEVTPRATCW